MARKVFLGLVATVMTVAGLAVAGYAHAGSGPKVSAVSVVEYNLGDTAFTDPPDWPAPYAAEVKGRVFYPSNLTGKLPLVVMLHGQAGWCLPDDDVGWPCPRGHQPFPSYRGYDYLGQALARQGFIVVSVSANGINEGVGTSQQRARLINRHLRYWQQLTNGGGPLAHAFTQDTTGRPARVDFRGRVDLTRVGTLGHSVGSGGVMQQASDKHSGEWPPGVRIRGVVAMASPGFFEMEEGDLRVTRASVGVISAQCWHTDDRQYIDVVRGRNKQPDYLATVIAGNHNFFNTVWTAATGSVYGDDTNCPQNPNRPTAKAQQNFAVAFLTAFYDKTLRGGTRGDDYLSGRKALPGAPSTIEYVPAAG